jgi:hypothetical protein
MSRSVEESVKSVPEVTAPFVTVPEPRKFPLLDASHSVKCVNVSVAATDVHVMSASLVIAPLDAAAIDTVFRVFSVATLVVPADPGSPVWSWMYTVVTENAVALNTASNHFVAVYVE